MIFAKEFEFAFVKDFFARSIAKRNIAKSFAKDSHKKNIVAIEVIDVFKVVVSTRLDSSNALVITTMTTNATTMIFLNHFALCSNETFRKARSKIFEFATK